MKMVDPATGRPLFATRCIELACAKCKEDGKSHECVHMLHLVPSWQSAERHRKLKIMVGTPVPVLRAPGLSRLKPLLLKWSLSMAADHLPSDPLTSVFCFSADVGPPRPHTVRAGRARLRQPAAGLPQVRHRDPLQLEPAAVRARADDLDRGRPGGGRAAVRLRRREHLPGQGVRRGKRPTPARRPPRTRRQSPAASASRR